MRVLRWLGPAVASLGLCLVVFGILGFGASKLLSSQVHLGQSFDPVRWAAEQCNLDVIQLPNLTADEKRCFDYHRDNAVPLREATSGSATLLHRAAGWSVKVITAGLTLFIGAMLLVVWRLRPVSPAGEEAEEERQAR